MTVASRALAWEEGRRKVGDPQPEAVKPKKKKTAAKKKASE